MPLFLALALQQPNFTAKHYFPLVAGTKWTYSDTDAPGEVIEQTVKEMVHDRAADDQVPGSETATDYYPIETVIDGISRGEADYLDKDDIAYHVGNGKHRPITPQPVLIVGRNARSWDFFINASAYSSEAVHFVAHSHPGPTVDVLGEPHDTVVVDMRITLGSSKTGIVLDQVWKYAADIGLYEMSEDGHNRETKIHHTRTLVKFEPGGKK